MSSSANLGELAQTLASRLYASPDTARFALELMRLLAAGQPVPVGKIASALSLTDAEAATALQTFCPGAELDDASNVVGYGLTLRPTPHRFHIGGHSLFTWCALDTLFYPVYLQQTAHVESICPATGHLIQLTVTPESVENLQPATAVVSLIIPESAEACCDVRGAFCNHVSFFSSLGSASMWLAQNPGAAVLSVAQMYQLGHLLLQHRLKKASQ